MKITKEQAAEAIELLQAVQRTCGALGIALPAEAWSIGKGAIMRSPEGEATLKARIMIFLDDLDDDQQPIRSE